MGKEEGITGDFNVEAAKPNNFTQHTIKGYPGTKEARIVEETSIERVEKGRANLGQTPKNSRPGPVAAS